MNKNFIHDMFKSRLNVRLASYPLGLPYENLKIKAW